MVSLRGITCPGKNQSWNALMSPDDAFLFRVHDGAHTAVEGLRETLEIH